MRGRGGPQEWVFLPGGWPSTRGLGWADPSVAEAQLARWARFVDSVRPPKPLGASAESGSVGEDDYAAHNTVMAFAYALLLAAGRRSHVTMLDWGGGLGQYAVLARSLAEDVTLEYHCRDLPPFVHAGRTVLPEGVFHDTDDAAFARGYDFVLASSSLQYASDWRTLFARLASATSGFLYVTRQPMVSHAASYVVLQRPHRYGYMTEYPGWVLNRDDFLAAAAAHRLTLRREFLIAERPHIPGAPEQPGYRGFLFESAASRS